MKNRIICLTSLLSAAALLFSAPALAEVKKQDANGFLVTHIADVKASPKEIWKRLGDPKLWWDKKYSWSGSVEGFSLDLDTGGCFCELMINKEDGGSQKPGRVEHMRVIHVNPERVLRMQGALGLLQSEAVLGTLTIALAATNDDQGNMTTTVGFNYIVGGYMRFPVKEAAKQTDKVMAAQFQNLIEPFADADEAKGDDWELDIDDLSNEEAAGQGADEKDDDGGAVSAPEIEIKPGETGR